MAPHVTRDHIPANRAAGSSSRRVVWLQGCLIVATIVMVWGFIGLRHLGPDDAVAAEPLLARADSGAAACQSACPYELAIGAALTVLMLGIGLLMLRQNRHLRRARQVLSDAVENIGQGLLMIDANGRLPLVNCRMRELLDIPPDLLTENLSFDELVQWQMDRDEFGDDRRGRRRAPTRAVSNWFTLQNSCYERTRPDGRVLEVRTQLLPGGGAVRTFTDVTAHKQVEQQIRHLAHHDALTGLANRTLLNDHLSLALHQLARRKGKLAVLALNLDRFKAVNDGFGQPVGDRLLVQIGARLADIVRSTDTLARIGGDEFVVVQPDVGAPQDAGDLARRMIAAFAEPFDIGGQSLQIGASIGIALYPQDGEQADALLQHAAIALDRAKVDRRGGFCFFESTMDADLRERRALEQDLRLAIGTPQLHLHFQPIFAAATRRVTGFEALLRWQHPVHGPIAPMAFIPIAEETGLILPLGAWVLEEACRAAAGWARPLRLAVNISAAQLRSGTLPAQVAEVLARTGLPAARLELEVTETTLIDDPEQALATLRALQELGVQIACDDFGTGYSSFGYLQNLSFNRIKIDKSFVSALEVKPSSLRIVQAIMAMANSLGMEVTAEGVETERQFAVLRELQCGQIQGYLLGRPMPQDRLADWIDPTPTRPARPMLGEELLVEPVR